MQQKIRSDSFVVYVVNANFAEQNKTFSFLERWVSTLKF